MAESYFELLTGQQGLPAKPFDPIVELKRLRGRLALRIQNSEVFSEQLPGEDNFFSFQAKVAESPHVEPVSLESVVKKVGGMKKTLTIWQRSRSRSKTSSTDFFRGNRRFSSKSQDSSVVAQYLSAPQEGMLEMVSAGLTALGVVGVVFGFLSFFRGWESDLSLGSLVCFSGAAIIAIGLGGRFLSSCADIL